MMEVGGQEEHTTVCLDEEVKREEEVSLESNLAEDIFTDLDELNF
jgi:hypothetical protein